MGFIRRKVLDWLGREVTGSATEAVASSSSAKAECKWMEVAEQVMASYVISAIQLCDIRFYGQDGHQEMSDAAWLWNVSPNPNQSRSELISELLGRLLVRDGRAVVVPVRRGAMTSIYVADGGFLTPRRVPGGPDVFDSLSVEGSTTVVGRPMRADEVYRFDMSGVGGGWHELQVTMDAQYDRVADSAISAMRDRNARKWILSTDSPQVGTADQQRLVEDQVRNGLKPFIDADSGVAPLYRGQALSRASADVGRTAGESSADVTAIRNDMFSLVAACFRMPASVLTGDMNSFEQTLESFLTFAVDPVARAISEEVTRKTYTRDQWANGARAVVDTTRIRHIDLMNAADAAAKLIGSSIDSPNEIRRLTGQDPIPEEWADGYQMTKNNESAAGGEQYAQL